MARADFGAQRSTCACDACVINCRYMPGFLIPADLDRLIPPHLGGISAILRWAADNLLASPGALVRIQATGEITRIPTLVPAVKPDGSCINLTGDNLCRIHEAAPFGCAYFSCGPEPRGLAVSGITAVAEAHRTTTLYSLIWNYLHSIGKQQQPPEVLRSRMQEAL